MDGLCSASRVSRDLEGDAKRHVKVVSWRVLGPWLAYREPTIPCFAGHLARTGENVPTKPMSQPYGYASMAKEERLGIDFAVNQDELRWLRELKDERKAEAAEIDRVWERENPKWIRPLKSRRVRPRNYKSLTYKEKVAVNSEINAHNAIFDADVRLEEESKREVWRIHLARLHELERPDRERRAAEAAALERLRLEKLRLRREGFKEQREAHRAANPTPSQFPAGEEPVGWKRYMDFGDSNPDEHLPENDHPSDPEDVDDGQNDEIMHPLDRRRR